MAGEIWRNQLAIKRSSAAKMKCRRIKLFEEEISQRNEAIFLKSHHAESKLTENEEMKRKYKY